MLKKIDRIFGNMSRSLGSVGLDVPTVLADFKGHRDTLKTAHDNFLESVQHADKSTQHQVYMLERAYSVMDFAEYILTLGRHTTEAFVPADLALEMAGYCSEADTMTQEVMLKCSDVLDDIYRWRSNWPPAVRNEYQEVSGRRTDCYDGFDRFEDNLAKAIKKDDLMVVWKGLEALAAAYKAEGNANKESCISSIQDAIDKHRKADITLDQWTHEGMK